MKHMIPKPYYEKTRKGPHGDEEEALKNDKIGIMKRWQILLEEIESGRIDRLKISSMMQEMNTIDARIIKNKRHDLL